MSKVAISVEFRDEVVVEPALNQQIRSAMHLFLEALNQTNPVAARRYLSPSAAKHRHKPVQWHRRRKGIVEIVEEEVFHRIASSALSHREYYVARIRTDYCLAVTGEIVPKVFIVEITESSGELRIMDFYEDVVSLSDAS
ncbi:MAG TPA: hypothetical protein VEF04_03470, partial [Blastocatellia bacterium]|nr:hypothetical protein [Blastocatellia bacterium]